MGAGSWAVRNAVAVGALLVGFPSWAEDVRAGHEDFVLVDPRGTYHIHATLPHNRPEGDLLDSARICRLELSYGPQGVGARSDSCDPVVGPAAEQAVKAWTITEAAPKRAIILSAVWVAYPKAAADPVQVWVEPRTAQEITLPPYLQRVDIEAVRKVVPKYPQAALKTEVVNTNCRVEVAIDQLGAPYQVDIGGCDAIFHDSARTALMEWRFTPIVLDGVPVKSRTTIGFDFKRR